MGINHQAQQEELRAAIAELKEAVNREQTEIHTHLDSIQRKVDEAGVDLTEEIAAIRAATQTVSGLVEPLNPPSSESAPASGSENAYDGPPPSESPGRIAPDADTAGDAASGSDSSTEEDS